MSLNCSKCRERLTSDNVVASKNNRDRGKPHCYCKKCLREVQAASKLRWQLRQRTFNEAKIIEFLCTHPCVDCSEGDIIVLEFDHLGDKEFCVAERTSNYKWERLSAEISKCVVRCANCHRRKTMRAANSTRSDPEKDAVWPAAKTYKRNLVRLLDYFREHPCVDCGEGDPVVLELDHVRGIKEFGVSSKMRAYSWARLLAEIAKCDARCANCHRRKTVKQLYPTCAKLNHAYGATIDSRVSLQAPASTLGRSSYLCKDRLTDRPLQ